MMNRSLLNSLIVVMLLFFVSIPVMAQEDDRFYEIRIYETETGQLDLLLQRFRAHTTQLFARHGIRTHGHWIPTEEQDKLYYLVSYDQREDREGAFDHFLADPEWKTVSSESQEAGLKLKGIESIFLELTDYSPALQSNFSIDPRYFEIRIYEAEPGKLADLHNRFRNHTISIFERLGMHNIAYWKLTDADQGAENTLLYLLGYESKEARAETWGAFRQDAEWIEAKAASEVNGVLVKKVTSIFMDPTDYSPIR